MFVGCALLFMVSGFRNRDPWSLTASVVFLAACVFFLLPLVKNR